MSIKSFFPTLWNRIPGDRNPYHQLQYDLDRTSENMTDFLPLIPRTAAARHASYTDWTPQLDVAESDHTIIIEIELPGVDIEDIDVSLDDAVLVVSGYKDSVQEKDKKEYRITERHTGRYKRAIPLGFNTEPEQIRATFKNGVLSIAVEKP